MDKKMPHIGKLIQCKMEEEGRKASWLAEKLFCDKSNISRVYKKKLISMEQLINTCIALEIDIFIFFSEYVRQQIQIQKKNKNNNHKNNNSPL